MHKILKSMFLPYFLKYTLNSFQEIHLGADANSSGIPKKVHFLLSLLQHYAIVQAPCSLIYNQLKMKQKARETMY